MQIGPCMNECLLLLFPLFFVCDSEGVNATLAKVIVAKAAVLAAVCSCYIWLATFPLWFCGTHLEMKAKLNVDAYIYVYTKWLRFFHE